MSQDKLVKLLQDVDKRLRNGNSINEWYSYAPVISDGTKHTVYLTNEFAEPSLYNKLCHELVNANEYDEFTLVINSPGGILDSAFMIINAINTSSAKITARLVGTIASAATIIALSCDELIISDDLAFMIHNYSAGMQGKGHEMKARQKFMDNQLENSFKNYYLGFLSEEEIQDILEGKDIWLNSKEVKDRWENKKALDE
mgnify:CR=1 FL=1